MSSPPSSDVVDRPAIYLWIAVLGGLTVLALQGFNEAFYTWWTATLHWLPPQQYMGYLFIACIPIHAFEAWWVHKQAKALGLDASAGGWMVQTFFLGYPSTALLKARMRAAEGATS